MLIYVTRFYDRGLIRKCKILLCKHKNCSDFLLCKEKIKDRRVSNSAHCFNEKSFNSHLSIFSLFRIFAAPFSPTLFNGLRRREGERSVIRKSTELHMNTKDENILFEKFCKLYDSTKNSPNPPDPFTFWVRINNDSKKDYISERFNSSSNVGIVSVGSRNTIRAISFQFNEKSQKVSICFAPDISRIQKKSGLSNKIVNSFISTLKKNFDSWNQNYTNIDDTLIQAIYNEYCLFFQFVRNYDTKNKTDFYNILKIKPDEFEKNIETHKKKYKAPVEEENVGSNDNYETSHPLNLILYGPPGTGKTYNTIAHAIAICDGVDSKKYGIDFDNKTNVPIIKDFELAKERYDTLKDAGQIVFTTFHQSMSYEDFIEGIRPEIYYNSSTKEKSILYNKKNGIFKDICETADENRLQAQKKPSAISHRYIQNLVDAFFDPLTIKKGSLTISYGKKTYQISRNSSTSYTVQLTPSVTRNLTLGIVERDYENFKNGNIKTYKDIKPSRTSKIPVHDNARLYWGLYQELQKFEDINKSIIDLGEKTEEPLKNFVLIIDEINRGNVAQIFGELITLIEPNKRLGEKEYLTTQLPYSSSMTSDDDVEEFGVPNNLYIIGTMNTADRSVEALDTALRRRFSFEEMMPDRTLLAGKTVCGFDLGQLLETINKRIVALKDREHQIGHSYFMGCPDDEAKANTWLTGIFKDKIIPLLQEYFYGDYKKIYYVLGPGFVEKKTGKTIFAVDVTNDGFDFDIPEEKYEIKTESFDIQQAIKDLKVQF